MEGREELLGRRVALGGGGCKYAILFLAVMATEGSRSPAVPIHVHGGRSTEDGVSHQAVGVGVEGVVEQVTLWQ